MNVALTVVLGLAGLFAIAAACRAAARATLTGPAGAAGVRGMPLTAAFGSSFIVIYAVVAVAAPVLAPFTEREIVGAPVPGLERRTPAGHLNRIGREHALAADLRRAQHPWASPLPPTCAGLRRGLDPRHSGRR